MESHENASLPISPWRISLDLIHPENSEDKMAAETSRTENKRLFDENANLREELVMLKEEIEAKDKSITQSAKLLSGLKKTILIGIFLTIIVECLSALIWIRNAPINPQYESEVFSGYQNELEVISNQSIQIQLLHAALQEEQDKHLQTIAALQSSQELVLEYLKEIDRLKSVQTVQSKIKELSGALSNVFAYVPLLSSSGPKHYIDQLYGSVISYFSEVCNLRDTLLAARSGDLELEYGEGQSKATEYTTAVAGKYVLYRQNYPFYTDLATAAAIRGIPLIFALKKTKFSALRLLCILFEELLVVGTVTYWFYYYVEYFVSVRMNIVHNVAIVAYKVVIEMLIYEPFIRFIRTIVGNTGRLLTYPAAIDFTRSRIAMFALTILVVQYAWVPIDFQMLTWALTSALITLFPLVRGSVRYKFKKI